MDPKLRSKRQFARLLQRYQEGKCTPEEESFVLNWYEATGNDSAATWDQNELKEAEARIKANLKSSLSCKIGKNTNIEKKLIERSFVWKTAAIAASVVFFIIAFGILFKSYQWQLGEISSSIHLSIITNDEKSAKILNLDDGTTITLQPNSTITLPQPFNHDKREVTLKGEGFFKVKRDERRPFIVYSGNVVTRVLGTSFNIKSDENNEIVVAVKTGKVSVSKQENGFLGITKELTDEVIITPNEQAVYFEKDKSIKTTLVEMPEIIDSQDDNKIMKFDNAPVSRIFIALEKAYQVEIEFNEELLKECTLTTTLNNENLFDRLNIICKATGGTYSLEGTKIMIQSNGCNKP